MTNDEKSILLEKVTETLDELVDDEPRFVLSGEVEQVDAVEQTTGYLHYFKLKDGDVKTHTIFYPEHIAAKVGELLSDATFVTVKTNPQPTDFGLEALWIYSTKDFLEVTAIHGDYEDDDEGD